MVVRMRHTRAQTANRRSHHALKSPALSKDQTGSLHLRHRMNPKTGAYRGRTVLDVALKATKRIARKTEKNKNTAA